MGTIVAANNCAQSSTSHHSSGNITRIDRELYKAAVEGDFDKFRDVQNINWLLTPNKNTVLHIHLTYTTKTSQSVQQSFVRKILRSLQALLPKTLAVIEVLQQVLVRGLQVAFPTLMEAETKKTIASERFVTEILKRCRDLVQLPNADGETPLHLAARYGRSTITKLLVDCASKDFPLDTESGIRAKEKLMRATTRENSDTALHEAVRYRHIKVVETLLEMDQGLLNIANKANETPLYMASERKCKEIVDMILEKVESPAYEGPNDRTALHAAVINGDKELARNMLGNEHLKAAVKHADKNGWVPLHYAVKLGNQLLTKLLLEKDDNNTSAYIKDKEGRTALHIAAYYGNPGIIKAIIEHCPDCSELVDNKGRNALHYAVIGDTYSAVDTILDNLSLSNIYNKKDFDGNTALHLLVNGSWFNSLQFITHRRVDYLALNKKNETIFDVAYNAIIEDTEEVIQQQENNDKDKVASRTAMDQMNISTPKWIWRVGAIRSARLQRRMGNDPGPIFVFSKEAQESHLIVTILIATVTFAAAFTLPGGTFQDGDQKGRPLLGHRTSFKAFIISNTIAMVLAASAAFIQLVSSPRNTKLYYWYLSDIAFTSILLAATAMMVAFATGMYTVLGPSFIATLLIVTVALPLYFVINILLNLSLRMMFVKIQYFQF